MTFDEYAVEAYYKCINRALKKGMDTEAVEVLEMIAQQNILLLKSYHQDVVLPLIIGCKEPNLPDS